MPYSFMETCQIRLTLFRAWQRKIPIENATKLANKFMKRRGSIPKEHTVELYQCFDKGDTTIFGKISPVHVSFFDQSKKQSNLFNSILLATDNGHLLTSKMIVNDGRFLFLFQHCYESAKSSIIVHDLFKDKTGQTSVSFDVSHTAFKFVGKYLLAAETCFSERSTKLHALKINYDNLNIAEIKTAQISSDFYYDEIIPDQTNLINFIISNAREFMAGQICDDKILLKSSKNVKTIRMHAKRLSGNKLHGFKFDTNNVLGSIKFYEIDLDTMVKKKTGVPIELDNSDLNIKNQFSLPYTWSKDKFYGMFNTEIGPSHLLSFDCETLKWSDVRILANKAIMMFVDENEVLTMHTGLYNSGNVVYRVNLRKPDTLVNLTWLTALRESSLYGNGKYFNVMKSLPIKF